MSTPARCWYSRRQSVVADRPAPDLGAHNAAVYGELLGLDEATMQTLQAQEII